jgi:hypothetical protein
MGEQQQTGMQAAFTDLPAELQSYVFACGAAPLHTCKASKAVLQDPYLAATWLLSNSDNIQDPLQIAMDLELWAACLHILNTQEHWPAVKLYSALRQAASGGHMRLVQALLSRGAWAEWVWSVEQPQLYTEEHEEWEDQLWQQQKSLFPDFRDFRDFCSYSHPLESAAREGHVHICTLFLQQKAITTAVKHEALVAAAGGGHLPVVQLLYKNDPGVRQPGLGGSALCKAATGSHLAVVRFLLDQGASPYNSKVHALPIRWRKIPWRKIGCLLVVPTTGHESLLK